MKTKQTLLGVLFLLLGIGVVVAAILPAFAHPAQPIGLWVLLAGLGCALFGAWLIPSSGAGTTINAIIVSLGNTNLPFVGNGRRSGDNPPPPPGDVK